MCTHKGNHPHWPQWSALEVRPYRHPHGFAEASPSILFFKKSLLPSELVFFITCSVLQSLWSHVWPSTSPFCLTLWEPALCESEICLAFCHKLLAWFTLCKVKLMIVIFIARGLERLTDHGMFGNWKPSHFLAHSLLICFAPPPFLGYKLLVVFIGKK